MFDIAVEQIVKVKPPKTAVIYKTLLIIGCIVAATTIPQTRTFGIIVLALFAVMTFLVFQYYNAELEYSMVDDTLTIDRIMAKSARKDVVCIHFQEQSLWQELIRRMHSV